MSTILLVGKVAAEIAGLEAVLKRYRHRVIKSRDGQAALDAMNAGGTPDIIIADIAGAGVLVGLRQRSPRLPMILLSGGNAGEDRLLVGDLGGNAYILRSAKKAKDMERMITAIVTQGKKMRREG